ncbi:MAG: cytochrome ubiquinol oxidase subunit I [Planctomycetaceae bacterium]|jgi:cytochrome bd-type quinol oxidase subunit 1|nr:cytochrome ubiquinol oxidase subunit I [Planctomycetaceae bacterium]
MAPAFHFHFISMHYPWWYVPVLTAPMLIAFIAVIHVFVSHYAVGGGILLALENQFAVKTGDKDYRDYLHRHARFFVLLTVAFGAITGVGIWWTIALTSPLATEMLIRTFVFGWAIEWVFFIIEVTAAFIMYYQWTRLPEKTHIIITWIYALAAWISLVLITGITAFMLDSRGLIADWSETGNFWHAFFNIQFLPQTVARTGGALLLAALYVLLHAAWTFRNNNGGLLEKTVRRMSKPLIAGIVMVFAGVAWSFSLLPDATLLNIERTVFLTILFTLFAGLSVLVTLMIVFGPIFNPKSVNVGFAVSIFILSLTALSVAEFSREAVRKPWIVDRIVLGNQIYASEVTERQKTGFLTDTYFTKLPKDKLQLGGMVFMYHCNNCHAPDRGLSPAGLLVYGESKEKVKDKIRSLNVPVSSMPPWCGTENELDALADYLLSLRKI